MLDLTWWLKLSGCVLVAVVFLDSLKNPSMMTILTMGIFLIGIGTLHSEVDKQKMVFHLYTTIGCPQDQTEEA